MAGVEDFCVSDLAAGEGCSVEAGVVAAPEVGQGSEVEVEVEAREGLEAVVKPKKQNSPGFLATGERVHDSESGFCCHQCRQKRRDCVASCKQMWRGKQCMIKICHKCLLNRYGERVEELEMIENWGCPRCRGVCNCSLCMKKKGQKPTGILIHAAKATGFSSVHALLDRKGSDVLSVLDGLKSSKGIDSPAVEKALSRIRSKDTSSNEQTNNVVTDTWNEMPEEHSLEIEYKRKAKRLKCEDPSGNSAELSRDMILKAHVEINETTSLDVNTEKINASDKKLAKQRKLRRKTIKTEVKLPQGTTLVEVADIDWPAEEVGPALQFLEFCNAFLKVLDLKEGEPEHLLRDLARGRFLRQVGCSSVLHFLTKLVSLIQEDMDIKSISYSTDSGDSWLLNVAKFIDKPEAASMKFDTFPQDPSSYDSLDLSKKLRVLNFLCDEALQTEKLRNWMESENQKYIEQKKETMKIKSEAKKKGDDLKKKMKDDAAKAMHTVKDGVPLTVTEQSSLISEIKDESGKAHAKMLETMGMLPKNKQRRDAMRTDPVLCEEEGRVYWELESYCNNSKILLQDVGSMSSTILQDRWLSYNPEEEKIIEKYIFSTRNKRYRTSKIAKEMDDGLVQDYESDNVEGDAHPVRGSESVSIDGDHASVCKSVNVEDDNHARFLGIVNVVSDDRAMCCESVNVPDDGHATCSEPVNVAGHHAMCCGSVNIPDDGHAMCCESVNIPDDHHAVPCESANVAFDNQAKDCKPDIVAMPSVPPQ